MKKNDDLTLQEKADKWDSFRDSLRAFDCKYKPICLAQIELESVVEKNWEKLETLDKIETYARELLDCISPIRQGVGHLLIEILSSKQSIRGDKNENE